MVAGIFKSSGSQRDRAVDIHAPARAQILFHPDIFRRLPRQAMTGMPVLPEIAAGLLLRVRCGSPVFQYDSFRFPYAMFRDGGGSFAFC